MANLRIISRNFADEATLLASSEAGELVVGNLQTNEKGEVYRSVGTTATITAVWTDNATVAAVGIPAANFSPDATIRVRVYDATDTLMEDTGVDFAAPGYNLGAWDWRLPLNANAFSFGGATKTIVWLDAFHSARKVVIDISDPTNPAGHIDIARLVIGGYWSPKINMSYGMNVTVQDEAERFRNGAGTQHADTGYKYDKATLALDHMDTQDRNYIQSLFRSAGVTKPLLISLMPEDEDVILEQNNIIYGRRNNSNIARGNFSTHQTQIEIEGW